MDNNVRRFRDSFKYMLERHATAQVYKSLVIDEALDARSIARENYSSIDAQQEHVAQRTIRQWFGKGTEINDGEIGGHPDFLHLAGTDEVEYHYITTIFVDIKNSTRLSLRYELATVQHIKNSILRAASETVRALDGHVHRFMGDALMGYFGGKGQSKESSAMAAISCAAMLNTLMKESVVPALEERGIDAGDLGFRVGIDFGDDSNVLWSSYGFSKVKEVTATSFNVDVSAKLQSLASKDRAMLGGSLIDFIDLPDIFTSVKNEIRNEIAVPLEFLRPNYALADGRLLNYKIRELNYLKFAEVLPIPVALKGMISKDIVPLNAVELICEIILPQNNRVTYRSLSQCLAKGTELCFQLIAPPRSFAGLKLPLRGKFTKQNYGGEAKSDYQDSPEVIDFHPREISGQFKQALPYTAHFKRVTRFRGVHVVTAEIWDADRRLIFRDRLGVHVI